MRERCLSLLSLFKVNQSSLEVFSSPISLPQADVVIKGTYLKCPLTVGNTWGIKLSLKPVLTLTLLGSNSQERAPLLAILNTLR